MNVYILFEIINPIKIVSNHYIFDCFFLLVFVSEKNLSIGCKHKLMQLMAELLKLPRFYFIDDKIDTFYEYNPNEKEFQSNASAACRGLHYLSRVLDSELEQSHCDVEHIDIQLENLINNLFQLKLESKYSAFRYSITEFLTNKRYRDNNKECANALYLLDKIPNVSNELRSKFEELFVNSASKRIGTLALFNYTATTSKNRYLARLQGFNKGTHLIAKDRSQVVLYNMQGIKGIHPVADDDLFAEPLSPDVSEQLVQSCKLGKLTNENVCRATRLGYLPTETAHVHYQILNGVTGFVLYYFSFACMQTYLTRSSADDNDDAAYDSSSGLDEEN